MRLHRTHQPRPREPQTDEEKLHAALAGPTCPICVLVLDELYSYFVSRQRSWEGEGEPSAAAPWCNKHAWQLYKLITADFLAVLMLAAAQQVVTADGPIPACPACEVRDEAEARICGLLAQRLEDEAIWTALKASSGLCEKHHAAVAGKLEREADRARLEHLRREQWARLGSDLQGYLQKRDPAQRGMRTEEERFAGPRALLKMAGQEGVI